MYTSARKNQSSSRVNRGRISRSRRLAAALAVVGTCLVVTDAAQANVVSISGSMEGAIRISNGDYVAAGINLSKTQASGVLELVNGTVTFHGKCSNGSSANTLIVDLRRGPYTQSELVNNEKEPASFQGSVVASVCGGGSATLDASSGAALSADVQGTNTSEPIQVQFHYRDPNAKGQGNYDCSAQSSASLGAAVCGASWSGTVSLTPDPKPPPPEPAFTIEKLQEFAGGGGFGFTTSPLTGRIGQTVDYEIIVKNTGNTTLTFSNFSDVKCDSGTIAGGPGNKALAPGESTIYTCDHALSSPGEYTNSACDTATPPEGAQITHCSNIVIVNPPASPAVEVSPFVAAVPSLKGPQGCARNNFTVSVKAAGVASITFYLDGRKLKTLHAKNAHHGLLAITVSTTRLSVGVHRLVAKITMAQVAGAAKPVAVTRTLMVVRCGSPVVAPRFTG